MAEGGISMKDRQEEELEETMRLLRADYLAVYAKS